MFKRSALSPLIESVISVSPISELVGLVSAHIAYPIAEKIENRFVRQKVKALRHFYGLSPAERNLIAKQRLIEIIDFAAHHVPYYSDLFKRVNVNAQKIEKDFAYLNDLPFLTKELIREQGTRMLSKPLEEIRHHICKTGGSTGPSCVIYYDQLAADYSAAVILYARERVGKKKSRTELHFACRFPDTPALTKWFTREDFKCFAMNRTNIFFDRLDDIGLVEIIKILKRRKPFLVHAHPSTIYALACYAKAHKGFSKLFKIFESSGELLQTHQRNLITNALQCEVIDRYGLAELGVMAYQLDGSKGAMQILESEGWAESAELNDGGSDFQELIFTGFRNRLMPLIRYRTGDLGLVERNQEGVFLKNVVGRIHDQVPINGIDYSTHYIQDMLDHRVSGIQEFQIDLRTSPPKLKIVPELYETTEHITQKVNQFWGNAFEIEFVNYDDLIRIGRHAKFRRVVNS